MKISPLLAAFFVFSTVGFFNPWMLIPACVALVIHAVGSTQSHTKKSKELEDAIAKYDHGFLLCSEAFSNKVNQEEHLSQLETHITELATQIENMKVGNALRFGK